MKDVLHYFLIPSIQSTRSSAAIEELLKLHDLDTSINGNYPLLWHCTKMGVPLSPAMMKHLIDQLHIRYGGALPIDIGNTHMLLSNKMVQLVFCE